MFFSQLETESIHTLRQAYKKQAVLFHPDKHEEEEAEEYTKLFQQMQAEYERILSSMSGKQYSSAKTSQARERRLADMIDAVLNIKGAKIDLCGCWLWVQVAFYRRHKISALGFRWSKKKARWYWGLTMTRARRTAKMGSMEEVYRRYGREAITSRDDQSMLIGRMRNA